MNDVEASFSENTGKDILEEDNGSQSYGLICTIVVI